MFVPTPASKIFTGPYFRNDRRENGTTVTSPASFQSGQLSVRTSVTNNTMVVNNADSCPLLRIFRTLGRLAKYRIFARQIRNHSKTATLQWNGRLS